MSVAAIRLQLVLSTLLLHFALVWVVLHAEPFISPSAHQFGFPSLRRAKQNFTYAGLGPPPLASTPSNNRQATPTYNSTTTTLTAVTITTTTTKPKGYKCTDEDMNCYHWVAAESDKCTWDSNVLKYCRRSCRNCSEAEEDGWRPNMDIPIQTLLDAVPEKYDIRNMPENLHKVAFLVGRWRSDFGGKADFPTIPRFTYGEELDFSVSAMMKTPVLNYTAFAWDAATNDLSELHSENGFVTGQRNSSVVTLNTVMSNVTAGIIGFLSVEQGEEESNAIRFRLRRIGRLNFSRDLPVTKMVREWTLLNETHLESRLLMATATHRMLLHTHIVCLSTAHD